MGENTKTATHLDEIDRLRIRCVVFDQRRIEAQMEVLRTRYQNAEAEAKAARAVYDALVVEFSDKYDMEGGSASLDDGTITRAKKE